MTASAREIAVTYQKLGWQVEEDDGRLELVTGTTVDALEVPRAAGLLASHWWLYTDGAADEIRKLPSVPCPSEAMATIAAGDRFFFLARAGTCPWTAPHPVIARTSDQALSAVIRWHSYGSRIPFPPARTDDKQEITWAHLPSRGIRLPSPAILLHLLATAVTTLRHGPDMLSLPGDVLTIPALGGTPPTSPSGPSTTTAPPRPAASFGFYGNL